MIEPEMAFADLEDDMRCAEDYVQHCCRHLLATCMWVSFLQLYTFLPVNKLSRQLMSFWLVCTLA